MVRGSKVVLRVTNVMAEVVSLVTTVPTIDVSLYFHTSTNTSHCMEEVSAELPFSFFFHSSLIQICMRGTYFIK